MSAALSSPPPARRHEPERRVVLFGIKWDDYVRMREMLDAAGSHARLTYLSGTLEIMTTGRDHEFFKKLIARLLEAWALMRGVRLEGYGEMTFQNEALERALEADECYTVGTMRDVPAIAIEVVISSALIDKLDVYAGLGVLEVWVYENGHLKVHRLVDEKYEPRPRSEVLPSLDLDELVSFVRPDTLQSEQVEAYVEKLRSAS
jgi:Uma2 family endonuclease